MGKFKPYKVHESRVDVFKMSNPKRITCNKRRTMFCLLTMLIPVNCPRQKSISFWFVVAAFGLPWERERFDSHRIHKLKMWFNRFRLDAFMITSLKIHNVDTKKHTLHLSKRKMLKHFLQINHILYVKSTRYHILANYIHKLDPFLTRCLDSLFT